MKKGLEVAIRNIDESREVEELVNEKIDKIEGMCDSLVKGRVLVEKMNKHPKSESEYIVHITMTLPPNHDVVVKKEPTPDEMSSNLFHILHDAFDVAERQVKKIEERRHPKQREKRKRVEFDEIADTLSE